MKVLCANQIELLLPATDVAELAANKFDALAPIAVQKGYLKYAVAEGIFKTCQVNCDGKPALVFWYSVTDDKGLWIHAAQSISDQATADYIFTAGNKLCRQNHCKYILFLTTRAGLIRAGEKDGFNVAGVAMVKHFKN